MSLFNFYRHIAVFFDDNGDQVGFKIFKRSFSSSIGIKKKTFDYGESSYNILPSRASRLNLNFKLSIWFNNFIYIYNINNPDPLSFKLGKVTPVMCPEDYKIRLKSNLVDSLNRAGRGKLNINWKHIIIGLVVLVLLYLVFSGKINLFGSNPEEIAENTSIIVNNITNSRG